MTRATAPQPAQGRHRVMTDRQATDGRQRMWASMRVLGSFTAKTLVTVTEEPIRSVRRYMQRLATAGYLRQTGTQISGKHKEGIWRLVRNTGPKAPRAGEHGVSDLNTGQTFDREGTEVHLVRMSDYHGVGGRARARADGVDRK